MTIKSKNLKKEKRSLLDLAGVWKNNEEMIMKRVIRDRKRFRG